MKNCKRVFVPGPCKKEAKLQTLINRLEDIVEKTAADEKRLKNGANRSMFPKDGCSTPVLTESQIKGKMKLLKRQAAGECILCRTDKSGKISVLSKELYIKKMFPHIEQDVIVDREEVKTSEKVLNATCAQFARVLMAGSDNHHEDRDPPQKFELQMCKCHQTINVFTAL